MSPKDVLKFWFDDLSRPDWYMTDAALDATIRDEFQDVLESASSCETDGWRGHADGALAEIIVLDQFSRNIHRGTPRAFAQDCLALALAQEALAKGFDRQLEPQRRQFLYLPFMHSESRVIHDRALELYESLGLEFPLQAEKQHKQIVDRFGRFPHRNKSLGRKSTPEEEAFLKELGTYV